MEEEKKTATIARVRTVCNRKLWTVHPQSVAELERARARKSLVGNDQNRLLQYQEYRSTWKKDPRNHVSRDTLQETHSSQTMEGCFGLLREGGHIPVLFSKQTKRLCKQSGQ